MQPAEQNQPSVWGLWKQFLPLSLSDVTMMFADPAITMTLAHLPSARTNMAAVGVAKSLAVFFESPIIMLLHASNTLGGSKGSRNALKRFTLISMAILSGLILFLGVPWVFAQFATYFLGIDGEVARKSQQVLLLMAIWPSAIAWRRYNQGLLIRYGHGNAVARAGMVRLVAVGVILLAGYFLEIRGFLLAGFALVGGVVIEALLVTLSAKSLQVESALEISSKVKPITNVSGVWKFYWPLANSMLVVWGGRAVLIAVIARAQDSALALAAWPAAWGLVLLVGNSTRMVQQVIIRNRQEVDLGLIVRFTASVGAVASVALLLVAGTPWGRSGVSVFLGRDLALISSVVPVLMICACMPLLIAFQNAMQALLISDSRTSRINGATWLGTGALLVTTATLVAFGVSGAFSAATGMLAALSTETVWLGLGVFRGEFRIFNAKRSWRVA